MSAGRARRIDKMMTTLINGYYKCLSSESKKDDKNHNNFGKMFSLQWWIKILPMIINHEPSLDFYFLFLKNKIISKVLIFKNKIK